MEKEKLKCIETEIWEASDKPGFVRQVGQRKVKEIHKEVLERLEKLNLYREMEYFYISFNLEKTDAEFPEGQIACYAVRGGNEGHYVHVDVLNRDGKYTHVFTGKTFMRLTHAVEITNALTRMFWEEI